jgi:uncharacterized membrane protein YraQ (UPF0718 family)
MTWQVTWSLILGFTLSAIIQALVRKSTIARLLPNSRPKSLATATVLGALLTGAAVCAMGQHLAWCDELLDRGRFFIDRAISGR